MERTRRLKQQGPNGGRRFWEGERRRARGEGGQGGARVRGGREAELAARLVERQSLRLALIESCRSCHKSIGPCWTSAVLPPELCSLLLSTLQ